MKTKFAPLPGSFMIVAMFGFLFAVIFLADYSPPWAFIVGTFSVILFGASLLSMTYAPVEDELLMDAPAYERKQNTEIISAQEALKRQHRRKQQIAPKQQVRTRK